MVDPYSDTNNGLHYDLRLDLDPQTHFVAVSGSLAYHSPQAGLERARFYLHRQFDIHRMEGRRVLGYHYETSPEPANFSLPHAGAADAAGHAADNPTRAADGLARICPLAGLLDIYFNPPLELHETVLIQFEYQGYITDWPAESANVITPGWTELGMYLPWFPFQYNGMPSSLTFTLKVRCPPGYQVGSYGHSEMEDGIWYFNWPHPTSDIVVVAGPSLESRLFESEANRVFLNSSTFNETVAAKLGEDMLWVLERLSGWFGPTRLSDFTLIESPRSLGGGYARRGLLVLGGVNQQVYIEQREAYLRYLAHEAAHDWWWEAPLDTWEDWLNESFAEYSGLLAVRERYGVEAFERFLDRKRERVPENLPLWGFERHDISTPEKQAMVDRMLYDKGPLLLHGLAERIGYQRFLGLCRAMLWSGVITTAHFLDLLEEVEDSETRQWMEKELKK